MRVISLHEVREALRYGEEQEYRLFNEVRVKENVLKAKEHPVTAPIAAEIIKEAEDFSRKSAMHLPFRRLIDFLENGNRLGFEDLFFLSKNELHTLVMAEILEDRGRFTEAIEERLWVWCNEYSWELPAHVPFTEKEIQKEGMEADEYIALFAAETAFYFAEILSLIKDKLHPVLVRRLYKEIDRRVLDSYEKRTFKWEDWHMNWSSVCAGSIGCAAIYCIKDINRLAKFIHRIIGSMISYLEGFDKDGITTEGLSYWQYGFSFYIYFSELLRERTSGRLNLLLLDEKIKKIAELPLYLQFPDSSMINFSDASGDKWFGEYHTLIRLAETFEIKAFMLPKSKMRSWDHKTKWAVMSRNVFWSLGETNNAFEEIKTGRFYFSESQWIIDRWIDDKGRFCAFAAKGGNNDEPHNHNDLGHFIIHLDEERIFCDLGAPEYVKDFFREKRYEFLHAAARGHSVPIINGHEQSAGAECISHMIRTDRHDAALMQLDLKAAYKDSRLQGYDRTFKWNAEALELTISDAFSFMGTDNHIKEVFVTHLDIAETTPGRIKLSGKKTEANLFFDEEALCEIKEEVYKNHFGEPRRVNRILIKYPKVGEVKNIDILIKALYKE